MLKRLKARYERRNPFALLTMALVDSLCWLVARCASRAQPPRAALSEVKRVLLVNPAHIGDVVISTAAIRRLKDARPDIRIGFVVGSWAKLALEGHPGVDELYVVDHWRLNRSQAPRLVKLWRHWTSWRHARIAIKRDGYDLGVLLNSFAPNLAPLLWFANVPVRVGYVSVGAAPLLNRVLPKPASTQPERSIQLQLLDSLGIKGNTASWLDAAPLGLWRKQEIGLNDRYVVLHPGTGNLSRSWPVDRWVSLAQGLCSRGVAVAVTGHGQGEYMLAAKISKETEAVNLVDRLSWDEWKSVLSNAELVVGVESAAGHVCAALNVKFVGIYSGMAVITRWSPTSDKNIILTQLMPCSPCHTRPCGERTCITAVTVDDVQKAVKQLLGSGDDNLV